MGLYLSCIHSSQQLRTARNWILREEEAVFDKLDGGHSRQTEECGPREASENGHCSILRWELQPGRAQVFRGVSAPQGRFAFVRRLPREGCRLIWERWGEKCVVW